MAMAPAVSQPDQHFREVFFSLLKERRDWVRGEI